MGRRRRQTGRIRDLARVDEGMRSLSSVDRALAFRLALGETGAEAVLDERMAAFLRRPSSLEPRVRDALRLAAFEILYLDTPDAVAASQGVELVRSVAPRAAGLANAVLRRLAEQVRPQVRAARERVSAGDASPDDLVLVSGLPSWLVERILNDRGAAFARTLCLAQMEPAPVYVAANTHLHDADELRVLLEEFGLVPEPVEGLDGSYVLHEAAALSATGLVERAELAVMDLSAQLVCRLAAPSAPCTMLEVGQGRGSKSLLLAAAAGATHPSHIVGVESVPYKVRVSRDRVVAAGLDGQVHCLELDARRLGEPDTPEAARGPFGAALVDAPCSGTGTMRRHPEIAASLVPSDVTELAALQLELLRAAATRVEVGAVLAYATCSVLREEDEDVVSAFLASDAGRAFRVMPVEAAPSCAHDATLAELVRERQTSDGFFVSVPTIGGGDGHFCALLKRMD